VLRVLFVANGHGETAIAARIAAELDRGANPPVALDLLALVGNGAGAGPLAVIGPRRRMPSGGLVAMGNVGAFSRDLRAGFLRLFGAQVAWLRAARGRYDLVVAVGDAYALALALLCRTQTLFVGTAKSVYVAPYGPFERVLLRRAIRIFVRDAETAAALRAARVPAEAPGNVIVDLVEADATALPSGSLGILPGSREAAYADGVRLARVVRALGPLRPQTTGLFSVAPGLEPARFRAALAADGWELAAGDPAPGSVFALESGGVRLIGWRGGLGAVLRASVAVLGQAGTANEQAAAFGVPVIAFGAGGPARDDWYRMRQRRLLGEALQLIPEAPEAGAAALAQLLADSERLSRMGAAGRRRMGAPGGAAAVARAILDATDGAA
jgi:uncharacterized protein (TIGR03492 family)